MEKPQKLVIQAFDKDGKQVAYRVVFLKYTDLWFAIGRCVSDIEQIEDYNDKKQWETH